MDININFSNYSKIQTEQKPQPSKISQHKFSIISIIFSILIIILIIVVVYRNKQLKVKEEKFSEIDNELNGIKSNITNLEKKINNEEISKNRLINNISYTNNEISNIKHEYDIMKSSYNNLIYNKNDLIAHKEFINNKKDYIQKCLKEEYLKSEMLEKNFLYQKMFQRFSDLSINNSNIIKDLSQFKLLTNSEILTKCYDSVVYDFNINRFHENCDGYPLLILIKTKTGQKIGAYTSMTNDGIKKIYDEKSMLINFDKNEYFLNDNNNEECYVYSHFDEFPKFGNDLIIHANGTGEISQNYCYKIKGDNSKNLSEEKKFEIEIMEIYRIKD
jgi:hypothetical protein